MAAIFFIFTNFILFFKLILLVLIKLFLIPSYFSKYLLIFICIFTLYILYTYPRKRFKKLSQARNYKLKKITKYALKNNVENIYNIFILSVFSISFTLGIFLLRYFNKDRNVDLREQYIMFSNIYNKIPLYDSVLNILIFILIVIIYFFIFTNILKYFKLHIIKRHLYLIGNLQAENFYESIFFNKIVSKIIVHNIYTKIIWNIHRYFENYYYKNFNKKEPDDFLLLVEESKRMKLYYDSFFFNPLTFFKLNNNNILFFILTRWHYILLLILFIYDLFYNNFQLTHVFYILPWTFFFEIYLRFSTFIDGLWTPHDQYLHTIFYAKQIEVWDKNTLLIDGEFYDYNHAKIIYETYVKRGFVKDPSNL